MYEAAIAGLPNAHAISIQDDLTLIGPQQDVFAAFDRIRELAPYGLTLRMDKCAVFIPESVSAEDRSRNDLLSSIQSGGGLAGLKKVSALPPPSSASSASSPSHPASSLASPSSPLSPPAASSGGPVDLNAALKSSLDRYRQFVQDEEDDDMDEWDE
jgi:hypothetical protein